LYQVYFSRQNDDGSKEKIPVDTTADPFHYTINGEVFEYMDPSWEHSPTPIRIEYEIIKEWDQ
jgi:hypothetical protein